MVKAYGLIGARACIPIYNALDPSAHFPVDAEPRFASDLSFAGNRLPDREARVDEFLVRAAILAPQRRFLLAGSGWQDKSLPENIRFIGHLFTKDHNAFNTSSLAVLNVCRESMARFGFSPPTRVFEVAGAGACLVTDRWEGIEDFLEPEREVLVAQNAAEVAAIVTDLDEKRALRIGSAARKRVLAEHTYGRRAAEVERIFDLAFQT